MRNSYGILTEKLEEKHQVGIQGVNDIIFVEKSDV
jgi:hypothetical protein